MEPKIKKKKKGIKRLLVFFFKKEIILSYLLKKIPDKVKYNGILNEDSEFSIFIFPNIYSICVIIIAWFITTNNIQIPLAVSIQHILFFSIC